MRFVCKGNNCEECPFEDCRRPERFIEDSEVSIKVGLERRSGEVYCLSEEGKKIARYSNATEASKKTGTSRAGISRCLSGHAHTAGGYMWRYV